MMILEQCFLSGNVDKSLRMNAQEMLNFLNLKVIEGEIESSDLPKLTTVQGWINRYSAQLRERNARIAITIGVEN